ncbi:LysM peptidoglycan-binding domain-containing protein [Algibacter sp. L4_22]|uniref:LysM peptidoglycan-binding domain-containing protein n=1 Tax=Algibacter sp. L4_22 TaxID=2942477 RepID=UPI00201B8BE5|nr:LysM peptidoglycan-binding domain-containing protein [Algibacter sp. L4_22]MCL5127925.1 LysM peptidoglycan-binding domain-containing protein [Algibacter sp. L4_22]
MSKFFSILLIVLVCGFGTLNAQNFSTHQVKKGETIESIAKRYFVTPADIYTLNPDAKKEFKANTILIIPISKANKPAVTTVKELKGFKTHKTKRKETLYSLGKKYDVSEDDIKKYNKFLYANTLRKGDKLQIPIFKETTVVEENNNTKPYLVKAKEGKWRIAYKFGITLEELEALNPKMGDVLKEGQQINVPNLEREEIKQVDETYGYYKVLPKEGFYRLKLKLGLTQEELEALNPGLKETGLKVGMILKTPQGNTNLSGIVDAEYGGVSSGLRLKIRDYSTKHIAVMLPFRLNRVEFDTVADTKRSIKNDPYLNASLDFQSGVLMAIDSLKTLGISLNVDVYDTKYEVGEVSRILSTNDFSDVDAVIGPLTPKTFAKVASELERYNIPVVSPIGLDLDLRSNVFQSRPKTNLLKNRIVNFVKADSLVDNVIILADSKHISTANELKRMFNHATIVYSRKNKKGQDENYVLVNDVIGSLKSGNNYVFLETDNPGFVSNVTSLLASVNKSLNGQQSNEKKQITLVTTNMNDAFEDDQVSNEHLSKLNFHFAATSKWFDESNNSFVKKYESLYNATPNKRAVRGFDLTMDVVLRLVSSNSLYESVNDSPLTEYIESKFAYKKNISGGYYNDSIYLVKHENLRIIEVK